MIAVDTNVLVYAHRRDSPFHISAWNTVRDLAQARSSWSIPWPCIHEFYAVVTHPKIYRPASTAEQAIGQVEAWLASPSLTVLGEPSSHWSQLRQLLEAGKVVGPLVHDARIAALCVGHGVRELWSADRDFSRFPQLKTRNPLV